VRQVVVDGPALRAQVADGAAALPTVLSTLDAAGVELAAVTVTRPSMDDVYLRYAGRSFCYADDAAADDTRKVA
jgi:ABC-2 type transport system ATP-binding protein